MPHIKKFTPNLIVSNVERSLAFYEGVLGFARGMTVPEQSPYVFASMTAGPVEIFFSDEAVVAKESPQLAGKGRGGGNMMFIEKPTTSMPTTSRSGTAFTLCCRS
jgi:catechol 2,3-dioxygenase-like lactoylglutathione lyase family enzyme